eukprot:scaffold178280_cov26-Prasinocladus_malaysianus.AAC.1
MISVEREDLGGLEGRKGTMYYRYGRQPHSFGSDSHFLTSVENGIDLQAFNINAKVLLILARHVGVGIVRPFWSEPYQQSPYFINDFGFRNHFTGHHEPPHLSGHGGAVRRGGRQGGCRHHGQQRCALPPVMSPAAGLSRKGAPGRETCGDVGLVRAIFIVTRSTWEPHKLHRLYE